MLHDRSGFDLAWIIAILVTVTAAVAVGVEPAPPQPTNAPTGEFSAERALVHLQAISAAPRPIGSIGNAHARTYIVDELKRLGWTPIVQETFACGLFASCATVSNVTVQIEGQRPGKSVLLVAHYDSVAAGPGASDDGAGVAAVLEVARALREGPPPLHSVLLLFADGEEGGLIGAMAFRDARPWAQGVGAVVNLDARGTGGASLLFEMSGDSGWLADIATHALPHPRISSVFSEVYERLPNDTDLTVFKRGGIPGVNFAFLREAMRYHTPLDDLAHVNLASLQHHGENALAMVRALASADLEHPPRGHAVFFDVLGLVVIRWPQRASLPLAALALAAVVTNFALLWRRGRMSPPALMWGAAAFAAVPIAAAVAIFLARVVWRLGTARYGVFPQAWLAHPEPALVALWATGLAAVVAVALFLARRAGSGGLWTGVGTVWAVFGIVSAAAIPGVCYLFVVPALAFGLTGLAWTWFDRDTVPSWAPAIAACASALVVFPSAWQMYDAIGLFGAPLVSALVAAVTLALAPLVPPLKKSARWVVLSIPAGMLAAGAIVAMVLPNPSPDRPAVAAIAYHQNADTKTAQWFVYRQSDDLPESMRQAASFGASRTRSFEWTSDLRPSFVAEAPPIGALPPVLRITSETREGERRRIRAWLTSPRGASDVFLAFPPGAPIESLSFAQTIVPPPSDRVRGWFSGWSVYRCLTLPPEGIELELVLRGSDPVLLELADQTPGLPPAGGSIIAARPATMTTLQDGDTTFVSRRIRI